MSITILTIVFVVHVNMLAPLANYNFVTYDEWQGGVRSISVNSMDKVTSSQFNRNARITFVAHFAASHSIIVNETVSSINYMMHHLKSCL